VPHGIVSTHRRVWRVNAVLLCVRDTIITLVWKTCTDCSTFRFMRSPCSVPVYVPHEGVGSVYVGPCGITPFQRDSAFGLRICGATPRNEERTSIATI